MTRSRLWLPVFTILACMSAAPLPLSAAGASLRIVPETARVKVGEPVTFQIVADTAGQPSFAAEAELSFDPNVLTVDHVSTDGSVLGSWATEPAFSNDDGVIRFSGLALSRFDGNEQKVLSVTFVPKTAGTGAIRILSGALLASDARGSNILAELAPATFISEAANLLPLNKTVSASISATTTGVPGGTPSVLGASTVVAPTIWDYPVAPILGERLIVKGTAVPDSHVLVVYVRNLEPEVLGEARAASDGSFVYASDERMQEGTYRLWAEVENDTGERGEHSMEVSFSILSNQVAASAAAFEKIGNGAGFLAAALVILGIGAIVFLRRGREAKQ